MHEIKDLDTKCKKVETKCMDVVNNKIQDLKICTWVLFHAYFKVMSISKFRVHIEYEVNIRYLSKLPCTGEAAKCDPFGQVSI